MRARGRRLPRTTAELVALEAEGEFQARVLELARVTGWLAYHTYDSRRSEKGFPDLVLVHGRRRRLLFVELKREDGVVSPWQEKWLGALGAVCQRTQAVDVHVWKPSQWDAIEAVLMGRGKES